ncbi:MAG: hypothetical protein ACI4TX_02345, partial [Christensenellales bacterium]
MKTKSIIFYKSLCLALLSIMVILCLTSCFENNLKVNGYLSAIKETSSVTKVVQTTNINDGNKLVYQCIVRLSNESGKVESEVFKKSLSQDLLSESDYVETSEKVYFSDNYKYSFDGNNW